MDGKSVRIGLASGSGALLGAFVSLQIVRYAGVGGDNFLFWLTGFGGIVSGGAFGYIAYDFKGFYRGVAETWQRMVSADLQLESRLRRAITFWTDISILEVFLGFWFIGGICLLGWILTGTAPGETFFGKAPDLREVKLFVMFMFVVSQLFSTVLSVMAFWEEDVPALAGGITFLNPVTAIFVRTPKAVFRGTRYLLPRLPRAVRAFGRFLKMAFILIHSDERLVCLTAAGFGAGFGHFSAGNAIAGGIVGFIVGGAEWEIVSKRILRVHIVRP